MNEFESLVEAIPIRHDPVSYLMFSGVLLGLVLPLMIAFRVPAGNRALRYLAFFLLALALIELDLFLCYTGWMKYTLAWNDSTEPLGLALPPLLYLCIRHLHLRRPLPGWQVALHFALPALYALSLTGYFLQPLEIKYNAYKDAYFQNLPFAGVPEGMDFGYHVVKDKLRWFILASFSVYTVLSTRVWLQNRNRAGAAAGQIRFSKYRFTRFALWTIATVLLLLLTVYLNYDDDGGDHYLGLMMSATQGLAAVAFLSESRFFQTSWLADKYDTAAVPGGLSLEAVREAAGKPDFYRSPDASLKALAARLDVHPNSVSRLINQESDGNFNDLVNGFRVELAKTHLRQPEFRNLTIEAIGKEVGFRSKSAFYEAFRKHTGISPSAYIKTGGGA